MYHPGIGRFMQVDPVGYEDQMNLYAYVHNDPMTFKDPSGEIGVWGAIAGAVVDYGLQVASNLSNGQSFSEAATNINVGSVLTSAALGAVGQIGGARLAGQAVTRLTPKAKGALGEAVARVGIAARGEKVIASQRAAGSIKALGNVTGRGAKSKPDFVVKTKSGDVKVVEAKFNTAQVTGAQKHLQKQIGDKFTVSRTTVDEVKSVGGAAGAAATIAGNCASGSSSGCQE